LNHGELNQVRLCRRVPSPHIASPSGQCATTAPPQRASRQRQSATRAVPPNPAQAERSRPSQERPATAGPPDGSRSPATGREPEPQLLAVDPPGCPTARRGDRREWGFTKSQAITDTIYPDDFNSCPAINSTFAICLTW
jgi:hypothetical protein